MNAHSRRFDACPPWALASLRAGLNLVDRERLQYGLQQEGIIHQYRQLCDINLGCPDLTNSQFRRFCAALEQVPVWLTGPSLVMRGAGAFVFAPLHAGFLMAAARALLGWTRGDVIGLPGVRLDYDRLAWSERSPDTSLINELQEVYAAAGVRIVHSADRYSALYGVYAPLEVLDPAASRAALHRLRGRHDERG